MENCQYAVALTGERLKLFRTIISVDQLSIYGTVEEMCEESDSCHDKTGRFVVEGQSNPLFVPSVIKTHILLTDDPAQQEEDPLQRYRERIEKLSQQDGVSKFCADAGFLTTVEVGQYFMTTDTEEFSQFTDSVACREYILPRDESLSEPKVWIRGNTKIGPVLEATTCCLQGKYGVEIRIEPMNKDIFSLVGHNFSWIEKVGHGHDRQRAGRQRAGNLRSAVRRICVEIECTCFCNPIKGQSKTTKTYFCRLSHKHYIIGERF